MKNCYSIIITIIFSVLIKIGNAQSPGNLGTANLNAWFKADSLALGNVVNWNSSYPTGSNTIVFRDTTGAPYPQSTDTSSGILNYNNVISFVGNSASNILTLGKLGSVNLINNNTSTSAGSFIMVYYLPTYTATGGHMLHYRESGGDGIQYRHLGSVTRCAIGTTNSLNGCRDYTEDYKPMIFTYTGNKSGASTMSAFKRSLLFTGGISSATTGDNGVLLGARVASSAYAGFFEGYIGEVLFYNTTLNATDLSKVHTYLALKYGVTLDNTGGGAQGSYISPSGKILWNAANNVAYHNNIIGLGREDVEGFYQKQSHTIDDSTRIYIDYLVANNRSNYATVYNDSSYLIVGNNLGKLSSTVASSLEKPSIGVVSRLEREWKVSNSNFTNYFFIDIKLDSIANLFSINPAHLCLLVDEDGDFSNATIYNTLSGISFSVFNGVVTISNIGNTQFPVDSIRYFTIGSSNINSPLPVKFGNLYASNNQGNVNLSWSTLSEANCMNFTVQRAFSSFNWEDIGTVKAKGNSNVKVNYFYDDLKTPNQNLFYRIKQTDFDGKFTYSNIVTLNNKDNDKYKLYIYPNLAMDNIQVNAKMEEFKIIDNLGKNVTNKVLKTNETENATILNINNLPSGSYFLITPNDYIKFFKL